MNGELMYHCDQPMIEQTTEPSSIKLIGPNAGLFWARILTVDSYDFMRASAGDRTLPQVTIHPT